MTKLYSDLPFLIPVTQTSETVFQKEKFPLGRLSEKVWNVQGRKPVAIVLVSSASNLVLVNPIKGKQSHFVTALKIAALVLLFPYFFITKCIYRLLNKFIIKTILLEKLEKDPFEPKIKKGESVGAIEQDAKNLADNQKNPLENAGIVDPAKNPEPNKKAVPEQPQDVQKQVEPKGIGEKDVPPEKIIEKKDEANEARLPVNVEAPKQKEPTNDLKEQPNGKVENTVIVNEAVQKTLTKQVVLEEKKDPEVPAKAESKNSKDDEKLKKLASIPSKIPKPPSPQKKLDQAKENDKPISEPVKIEQAPPDKNIREEKADISGEQAKKQNELIEGDKAKVEPQKIDQPAKIIAVQNLVNKPEETKKEKEEKVVFPVPPIKENNGNILSTNLVIGVSGQNLVNKGIDSGEKLVIQDKIPQIIAKVAEAERYEKPNDEKKVVEDKQIEQPQKMVNLVAGNVNALGMNNLIPEPLKPINKISLSGEEIHDFLLKGDDYYKKKNYKLAFDFLTRFLICSEGREGEDIVKDARKDALDCLVQFKPFHIDIKNIPDSDEAKFKFLREKFSVHLESRMAYDKKKVDDKLARLGKISLSKPKKAPEKLVLPSQSPVIINKLESINIQNFKTGLAFEYAVSSTVGLSDKKIDDVEMGVRYLIDSFKIEQINRRAIDVQIFALFDGQRGYKCAEHCKKNLVRFFKENLDSKESISHLNVWMGLKNAFADLNDEWKCEKKNLDKIKPEHSQTSICTALVFKDPETNNDIVWTANVGDTRLILGEGGECYQISTDAVYRDEAKDINSANKNFLNALTWRNGKVIQGNDGIYRLGEVSEPLRGIGSQLEIPGLSARPEIMKIDTSKFNDKLKLLMLTRATTDWIGSQEAITIKKHDHR